MSKYRYVYSEFWIDPEFQELTAEERYFFLYLLTNPHTKQSGIYVLPLKIAEVELGYTREKILKLISKFETMEKVKFNNKTFEIALKNWPKYNLTTSDKVITCIQNELKSVKDTELILFVYGNHTLSIPYQYPIDTETQRNIKETQTQNETKKETQTQNEEILPSENLESEIIPLEAEEKKITIPAEKEKKIPYSEIVKIYHNSLPELSKISLLNEKRKNLLKARWREDKKRQDLSFWIEYFLKVKDSNFLTGKVEKSTFIASFDWLLNESNMLKTLEGNYDNRKENGNGKNETIPITTATGSKDYGFHSSKWNK